MAILIMMSTGSCAVLSGESLPVNYKPTQMPRCSVGAGEGADIGIGVIYGVIALVGLAAKEISPMVIGGLGSALHFGSASAGSTRSEQCRRARKAYAAFQRTQQQELQLAAQDQAELQERPKAEIPLGMRDEIAPDASPSTAPEKARDSPPTTSNDVNPLDAFWTETTP